MEVVVEPSVGAFARCARPLFEADPVRHTTALTVLDAMVRGISAPALMLTVRDGGAVVGAVLSTSGRPVVVSALPPRCAPAVADALRCGPDPRGALGPVEEAEAFGAAWAACTGVSVAAVVRLRLFALGQLRPPVGVPGAARAAAPGDAAAVEVLGAWRAAFAVEVHDGPPTDPRRDVTEALAAGTGELLWEVDGTPVAYASARGVVAGTSRIGPVYTPPEHRRRGYAAAVTAAAARWALDHGARQVLLYTDLANPTTNRLYPRLGFRPLYDAVELHFGAA